MDIFDDTIREVKGWFREKGDEINRRDCTVLLGQNNASPTVTGNGASVSGPPIILREDTHIELGHPTVGSCSAVLATGDTSLIERNQVSLLGPDIPETDETQLPFAQIIFASCKGDVIDTSSVMERILHRAAQSKEYMIRSVPNLIWSRVSKAGARAGFSLHGLACRLIDSLHRQCEAITGVEVMFATSSRGDVATLNERVEAARHKLRQYKTYRPMSDGTYECETALDCEDCEEQPVCDSIRDIIKIRKGSRIVSFGPG